MPRYIDADALLENLKKQYGEELGWQCTVNMSDVGMMIEDAPTADVAPRVEVFEGVDKFRSDLMDKFIDLCRGNDYNKLTLLKIGDTVDQIYDKQIAELKKKYTDAADTNVGHKRKEDNQ